MSSQDAGADGAVEAVPVEAAAAVEAAGLVTAPVTTGAEADPVVGPVEARLLAAP